MTRACQALILVGTATRSAAERWTARDPEQVRDLLSARSCLDWIGTWMTQRAAGEDWTERASGEHQLLQWIIHSEEELSNPPTTLRSGVEEVATTPAPEPGSEPLLNAVLKRLSWRYPDLHAVRHPAKVSVSSLRQGILAQVEDGSELPRRSGAPPSSRSKSITAAEAGVAHHTFLQWVQLEYVIDDAGLIAEAARLEQLGVLSDKERAALDLTCIATFWRSTIGQEILARREHVRRELPFTAKLLLAELTTFTNAQIAALQDGRGGRHANQKSAGVGTDEYVVLNGVVDLAVVLPSEIWLLDFKTDAVAAEEWRQKASQYASQMNLYSLALSRIYQRPVTHAWLHSLPLRRTLDLADSASA